MRTSDNILRHAVTYCNSLQHTHWSYVPQTTYWTRCNMLQHTATHCNTLQHTATHSNTRQHTAKHINALVGCAYLRQHIATRCDTLQHTATLLSFIFLPQARGCSWSPPPSTLPLNGWLSRKISNSPLKLPKFCASHPQTASSSKQVSFPQCTHVCIYIQTKHIYICTHSIRNSAFCILKEAMRRPSH